jgi:hypothetical protein
LNESWFLSLQEVREAIDAVGGIVAWLVIGQITLLIAVPVWIEFLVSALVGGVASYLGVYLLANTDTKQRSHCLAFAVACGLSWKPVVEAATTLVSKGITQNRAEADTANTKETARTLNETAAQGELPSRIDATATAATNLVNRLAEVQDTPIADTARRQVTAAIGVVEKKGEKEPMAAVQALAKVSEAAAAAKEPDLSLKAGESLYNLGTKTDDKAVTTSAVAGLERVELMARAKAQTPLALQLRARREEMVRRIQ